MNLIQQVVFNDSMNKNNLIISFYGTLTNPLPFNQNPPE